MSESHKRALPIIERHLDRIGWTWTHREAHLSYTGERADIWAVADRPVEGAFKNLDGKYVDLLPGMSSVHEFKATVQDLRKDRSKPWRKRGYRALGEFRYYWFEVNGEVRPEHVDEAWGWGVVLFDEHKYEIVRPSAIHPTAFRDSMMLARKLERQAAYQAIEKGGIGGPLSRTTAPSPMPATRLPNHIELVKEFLSEEPANTSMLTRHLLEEHGYQTTSGKLTRDMLKSRLFVQDGVGGNWSLKAGVLHGA